jgi:hypothetical protein
MTRQQWTPVEYLPTTISLLYHIPEDTKACELPQANLLVPQIL